MVDVQWIIIVLVSSSTNRDTLNQQRAYGMDE